MGRPRKKNTHLPPCLHPRHGAFYLVKKGRWERLSADPDEALRLYRQRMTPAGESGMVGLIRDALPVIQNRPKGHALAKRTKKQMAMAARRLEEAFKLIQNPREVRAREIIGLRRHLLDTPGVFNQCLSLLRQVFDYALEEGLVDDNPARAVKRLQGSKRTRLLTHVEFDRIYKAATPRLRCMLDIWRITGQRVMDVVNIKLSDLLDEGVAFRQQKTGARVTVEWTPELRKAVAAAKKLNRNVRATTLFATASGPHRGKKAPGYAVVNAEWVAAREAAGVTDAQTRDLRAVSATEAERQGLNPQELLGHTVRQTTTIYLRDREPRLVKPPSFGRVLDSGQKTKKKQ